MCGWPSRPFGLAPPESDIPGAGFLDRGTQEYLASEVIDGLPPAVRRYLVAASLFDQFNAQLARPPSHDVMTGPTSMTGDRVHRLDHSATTSSSFRSMPRGFGSGSITCSHVSSITGGRRTLLDLGPPGGPRRADSAAHHLEHAGLIEEAIAQLTAPVTTAGRTTCIHPRQRTDRAERWADTRPTARHRAGRRRRPRSPSGRAQRVDRRRGADRQFADMSTTVGPCRSNCSTKGRSSDPGAPAELRGQIAALRGAYVHMVDAELRASDR